MLELIFDNEAIVKYWKSFFESNSTDFRLNDITKFEVDFEKSPEDIIYLNCTGKLDNYTNEIVKIEQYLDLLAIYNRKVINDFNTVNYTFSLIEQYRLFKRFGLTYPQIVFSSEEDELVKMTEKLPSPFQLISNIPSIENDKNIFENVEALREFIKSENNKNQFNEIRIARQYIKPKENMTYRALLIDRKIIYVYCIETKTYVVELMNNIENIKFLLEKYAEMVENAGYNFVEVEFLKAENNVIYTTSINPFPIFYNNIESVKENAGKFALIELIK